MVYLNKKYKNVNFIFNDLVSKAIKKVVSKSVSKNARTFKSVYYSGFGKRLQFPAAPL